MITHPENPPRSRTAPVSGRTDAIPAAPPPLAARHFLARLAFETDPSDLAADLAAGTPGIVVVDTRAPDAFADTHIRGALNLPHATIDENTTAHLDRTALYVTYCWGPACNAAARGAANLASLGFRVKELAGGLAAWRAEGFPVTGEIVADDSVAAGIDCAC